MPRTAEANKLIRDKRAKQILQVALRLFCLEEYEKVPMDRIAKEAHISHGLIYHYFSQKSDILKALLEEAKLKFNAIFEIDEMREKKGYDFFEYLTNFIISTISLGTDYSYYLALILSFKIGSNSRPSFENLDHFKQLEENFVEGQKEGKFAPGNPRDYILCYLYLIYAIVYGSILSNGRNIVPPLNVIMNVLKRSD